MPVGLGVGSCGSRRFFAYLCVVCMRPVRTLGAWLGLFYSQCLPTGSCSSGRTCRFGEEPLGGAALTRHAPSQVTSFIHNTMRAVMTTQWLVRSVKEVG